MWPDALGDPRRVECQLKPDQPSRRAGRIRRAGQVILRPAGARYRGGAREALPEPLLSAIPAFRSWMMMACSSFRWSPMRLAMSGYSTQRRWVARMASPTANRRWTMSSYRCGSGNRGQPPALDVASGPGRGGPREAGCQRCRCQRRPVTPTLCSPPPSMVVPTPGIAPQRLAAFGPRCHPARTNDHGSMSAGAAPRVESRTSPERLPQDCDRGAEQPIEVAAPWRRSVINRGVFPAVPVAKRRSTQTTAGCVSGR